MSDKEEQNAEAAMHLRDQKIFQAFDRYDMEKFGYISVNDLRTALEDAGELLTVDEIYWIISVQDPQNTGHINLA